MTQDEHTKNTIVCAATAIGGAIATYILMRGIHQEELHKLRKKAIEQIKLRNEVLEWLLHEAPHEDLTSSEMSYKLNEKIQFINAVSSFMV